MSHIIDFTIEGLAGRDQVYSQKLNRDTNIFFGLNGSGKTSLLKILQSAMSNETEILNGVAFRQAEVRIYSESYKQTYTYTISKPNKSKSNNPTQETVDLDEDLINNYNYNRVLYGQLIRTGVITHDSNKLSWTVKPKLAKDFSGGWQHRYLPTSRLYLGSSEYSYNASRPETPTSFLSEQLLDRYFAQTLQGLWAKYSANILTAVRKAQEDGLANILKAILSTRTPRETAPEVDPADAYKRVAEFLTRQGSRDILGSYAEFEHRYSQDSDLRSVVSDINEVEHRIEEAMAPRYRIQKLIQTMFSGNKEVFFRDQTIDIETNDKEKIGLSLLSSGEKHLLRILIETLLARESTIFIDEPEISLHIDWQRHLIQAMQELNPRAQLIVATHSPEIMAEIDDNKIFRI